MKLKSPLGYRTFQIAAVSIVTALGLKTALLADPVHPAPQPAPPAPVQPAQAAPAAKQPSVFQRVQALRERNGRTGGVPVRNQFGALLQGLIRCVPCACAMTPSHSIRGVKRHWKAS